jgi:UDP-2,3-diacylglucosamine hydrolase
MTRLGLIAGNGRFPLLFVEAARAQGADVVVVAHQGETPEAIATLAPAVNWVRVGELGKIIATLRNAGVTEVVMAGGIYKAGAMTDFQPDARGLAFISRLPNLKDDVILRGIAHELESEGMAVIESTRFLSSLIPQEDGPLTSQAPDAQQWDDVRLGCAVVKEIGRWDIGQSVVVKRGAVVAVEGIEGTSATIRRGGTLAGAGTVVVKMSKPQQDLRFDIPAIGLDTIAVMQEAQATVLALETRKTLMIDKPAVVQAAEAAGIRIVAVAALGSTQK